MKKIIMTFAVMAFLIGGLTINANAQEKKVEKKAKVENTQNQKKLGVNKAVDIDKMLKDYGTNVDKYIETYKAALKGDKSVNKNTYEGYKKTAQKLEGQLEKIKEDMSPTQVKIFEKTKAKFAEALTEKGQK
jgi:hypothetical protein